MSDPKDRPTARPGIRQIRAFVAEWYRKLDEHVPLAEVQTMLLDEGLEYVVPEGVRRNHREFGDWYEGGNGYPGAVNVYFDEVHSVEQVRAVPTERGMSLEVVVNWQSRRWRPPVPRSQWTGFDAFQSWDVVVSPSTGSLMIARYVVDRLVPMPGSPSLD